VPQVVRSLRRSAVVGLGVLALSASSAAASGTGGATAQTQATAAAKPSVKQVQKALGIKADGVMGPQTVRALKRFQRAHGIRVSGKVNAATLKALGITPVQTDRSLQSSTPTGDPVTILARIAQCESGGDITAVSANGRYFGKYQFSRATWEALGGSGSPADADEATQDLFAARLYADRGTAPWPACAAER
jgi:peptidoglycan hydrolase-like protein with peptidoglycan-binding domain